MFFVSWIEGNDINYRFLKEQELANFLVNLGDHVIVQKLAS